MSNYYQKPYLPSDLGNCFQEIVKQTTRANALEKELEELKRDRSIAASINQRLENIENKMKSKRYFVPELSWSKIKRARWISMRKL